MMVARDTQAQPAVKSTYELVQMFLLIGKDQFHIRPAIIPSAPTEKSPLSRSSIDLGVPIQRPARMPRSAVPTAGIVENKPSGSQVTLPDQLWLPSPKRDQSSRSRSHQAAIVCSGPTSCACPRTPVSGTGRAVIANQ